MTVTKFVALVAGLAFARVNAGLMQRDETTTSTLATAASTCLSPSAMCGTEISWGGGFFGRRDHVAEVYECYELCTTPRRWGVCNSFLYTSSGGCRIFEAAAEDVGDVVSGTGDRIWDKECGDCGVVPSPTGSAPTTTSTCLSPAATCEVEVKAKSDASEHVRGTGSSPGNPYVCWELCSDGRRPADWCVAFSWDPSTGQCILYDESAGNTHDADPGSGLWVWDKECWSCEVSGYT